MPGKDDAILTTREQSAFQAVTLGSINIAEPLLENHSHPLGMVSHASRKLAGIRIVPVKEIHVCVTGNWAKQRSDAREA